MKKTEFYRQLINDSGSILKCPVCGRNFEKPTDMTLKCQTGHSYDISSHGYINLFGGQTTEYYTKDLFEARRKTVEIGFFKPIYDFIASAITEKKPGTSYTLLDAGCGEGSALNYIISALKNCTEDGCVNGIGIDISKEGIRTATSFKSAMWLVSDIASLPVMDNSVEFLINILSPANYSEFVRVVKKGGYVIKVIPCDDYLKELRESSVNDAPEGKYSNNRVVNLFKNKFGSADVFEHELKYDFKLPDSSENMGVSFNDVLSSIINMTPLCRNTGSCDNLHLRTVPESICVHVKILVAKI